MCLFHHKANEFKSVIHTVGKNQLKIGEKKPPKNLNIKALNSVCKTESICLKHRWQVKSVYSGWILGCVRTCV